MERKYAYNEALPFAVNGYKGNVMIEGKFAYEWGEDRIPYKKLLQSLLTMRKLPKWNFKDTWKPEVVYGNDFFQDSKNAFVWLGHSTFIMKINEKIWITDPIFFDLSVLMKRRHALPCAVEELPKIDYILLSHGHRDHLDIKSLKAILKKNGNVQVYCPLGHAPLLKQIGIKNIQEAAWYQKYDTIEGISLILCPARHWNRRHVADFNRTLWGSFFFKTKDFSIYFGGDTAYGNHFLDIKDKLSAPDYAFLPVGAYLPKSVMSWAHISPFEAIQAFLELGAKHFVPMHYGTYRLSAETAKAPVDILRNSVVHKEIIIPRVGEICTFQPSS
jgi:L-ascorbate metabolism protein UlaG (beta-lactamase superfamily)